MRLLRFIANQVGGWQVVLGALTAILAGSALSAIWGFGAAMFSLNAAFLLTPFGWFVTGVTAVVGAVALLISKWERGIELDRPGHGGLQAVHRRKR